MEEYENNIFDSENTAETPAQENNPESVQQNNQNTHYQQSQYQQPHYQQPHYQQPQYQQPQYQHPQYQPQYQRPQYQYNPQQNNRYQQGGYGYSQTANGTVYQPRTINTADTKNEKKSASHGFVIGMVAIGLVLSMLFGSVVTYALVMKYGKGTSGTLTVPSGEVVINHGSESKESPLVTENGNEAYAASVALDSVVEVRTETAQYNSIYGQYVTEGAGSGVIISSTDDGTYIITCAHVISGASQVKVILSDGNEYSASFTASDTITDIGVIKIDVKGLKTANVGSSKSIVVGEKVIAIGNPLGTLGGSVTSGVVSALEREIKIDGVNYSLIQTSAEISPGNSGGGLFNMNGNLIGIVNAKSGGDYVEGLGFAIPIDKGIEIFEELVKNGYISGRVKIGVQVVDIQSYEDIYSNWKYSKYFTDYGVYVIESESDLFHIGDRIVSIDNLAVKNYSELRNILLEYKVGDKVEVQVSRLNSKNRAELVTFEITLTENKQEIKQENKK